MECTPSSRVCTALPGLRNPLSKHVRAECVAFKSCPKFDVFTLLLLNQKCRHFYFVETKFSSGASDLEYHQNGNISVWVNVRLKSVHIHKYWARDVISSLFVGKASSCRSDVGPTLLQLNGGLSPPPTSTPIRFLLQYCIRGPKKYYIVINKTIFLNISY